MSQPTDPREGTILDGKYRLVRVLGKGGMGTVFLAENTRVKRQVAIKILSKAATENTGDAVLRFEREAQAAGQIGSDHIVEVLDLGTTDEGDRFMVMELLEGETLKERSKKGRLPTEKVVEVFRQLLDGLEAAHAAGIIHRDLKPDNVFLQREKAGHKDWVKIVDFGISKFAALGGEAAQHTRTGMVMGTPYYMSPEQARAASTVDARSDLYTVGVMLYEMLTGQVPFGGTTLAELMFKIVFEPQPHPRSVNPTLDDEMAGIIVKAMSRNPEARFQDAAEFRAALVAWDEKRVAGLLPAPTPFVATNLGLPPHAGAETSTIPPASTPMGTTAPPISASHARPSSEQAAAGASVAPKKSLAPWIAAVVAVALAAAGGAYFASRGAAPQTNLPPTVAATPAPIPTPEPAPAATPSVTSAAKAPEPATSAAEAPAASAQAEPNTGKRTGTWPPPPTSANVGTKKTTKKVVTDYGY